MRVVTALQAKRAPTIRKRRVFLVRRAHLLLIQDRDIVNDALLEKHQMKILQGATLVLAIRMLRTALVNAYHANLQSIRILVLHVAFLAFARVP